MAFALLTWLGIWGLTGPRRRPPPTPSLLQQRNTEINEQMLYCNTD